VELSHAWDDVAAKILRQGENSRALQRAKDLAPLDSAQLQREFVQRYVPERWNLPPPARSRPHQR
jgi:hypothetical protein